MTGTLWAVESSWTRLQKKNDDTLVKNCNSVARVPGQFPLDLKFLLHHYFAPLLHGTCGAFTLDEKDLTVSSGQGNA